MNQLNLTHPASEDLVAFGLGRLDEAASTAVEEHLAACETCRTAVESAPVDSFVAKVRASQPRTEAESAAAASSVAGERTQAQVAGRVSTAVPPELTQHPRYQVLGLLGVGGMGAVFKAEHKLMQRTVALKVINSSLVANSGTR